MRELARPGAEHRSDNERGAILVLVGFATLLLFAASSLVIDMGRNLSENRHLSGATDAAALAAAQAFADGTDGCAVVAADFLTRNHDDATLRSCVVGDNGSFGWVVVESDLVVNQILAGTIGFDSVDLEASSVGVFGEPSSFGTGTRPMGLCLDGLQATSGYAAWQAAGATTTSPPIKVLYNNAHPDLCGDTTGSWGFVDFDGGSNSNNDTRDWIQNGYPGPVTPGTYEGDPGAISGSHKSALQSLVDDEVAFWLPVFTNASGNGANVEYEVTTFLSVRLTDFKTTGKQSKRYLEFIIDPGTLPTSCCGASTTFDTGNRATGLFLLDESGTPMGVTE